MYADGCPIIQRLYQRIAEIDIVYAGLGRLLLRLFLFLFVLFGKQSADFIHDIRHHSHHTVGGAVKGIHLKSFTSPS